MYKRTGGNVKKMMEMRGGWEREVLKEMKCTWINEGR